MEACTLVGSKPIIVSFTAAVTVPVGFVISDIEDAFKIYSVIDRDSLYNNTLLESKEARVAIEEETLVCDAKVRKYRLVGSLFYNTIITGFVPKVFLDIENMTVRPTSFSQADVILLDHTLGYSCLSCQLDQTVYSQLDAVLINTTPFVITESGSRVFYNEQDPTEFFEALSDGDNKQVINIPYTLTITPVI